MQGKQEQYPPPYPTQGAPPYPVQGAPPYPAQAAPPYPPQDGGYPGVYPPQQGAYPPQPAGYQQPQQQQGFLPYGNDSQYGYGTNQQQGGGFGGGGGLMGAQSGMSNFMRSQMQGSGGYDSDAEGGNAGGNAEGMDSFADKAVRRGFIRKVYGILTIQLAVTFVFICCFVFIESLRLYALRSRALYWVAFAVMMVCMIAMACCESVRRKAPTNYIFLGVFTICQGFMLGTVTAHFQVDAVLMAVGICAAITLALTVFAFQTKYDFTTCGGMLCGMTIALMLGGLLVIFFPSKWAMIGYGTAGAVIFSLYIVYDTQLMMGGNHKCSISPEEYIFAALSLYLDIVNLFMYILMIIGASRGD